MSGNLQKNSMFKKITYEKVITAAFLAVLAISLIINMIFQNNFFNYKYDFSRRK